MRSLGVSGAPLERQIQGYVEGERWGEAHNNHGLVIAGEDGEPLRPKCVTCGPTPSG